MDETDFTLPVHYVRHIADQVRSRGVDVDRWLAQSELTEAKLREPSAFIGFRTFERLVASALNLTAEPALGLFVGERLLANSHGILGYAATTSATVGDAVTLFELYSPLRTSMVSLAQTRTAEEVRIRFQEARPLGDVKRPVLEAIVMSVKRILDAVSMGSAPARAVAFAFAPPPYAPLARDLFGCDVAWDQSWTGLEYAPSVMEVPLQMADPEASRQTMLVCQRELEKLTADESLTTRVRRLLLEAQSEFPSLNVAARLVRLTPRTLHRRLLDEGTSFRALLEETRHALAVEHLKAGRLGMEKLAYTLGYSDLANFRRAFKRWESVSPSTYRAKYARHTPETSTRARRSRR
jgi:AraC-like DNA-binding protein